MAEMKWIRLYVDMFDNKKIKHIRRMAKGDSIVLIWVMLLTMAGRCNSGGKIFLTENVPFTVKMLAAELDFTVSTVSSALETLEQLDMISTGGGFIEIVGWKDHQNGDRLAEIKKQTRDRVAKCRDKKKTDGNATIDSPSKECNATCNATSNGKCNATVTLRNAIEEDKEEDIDTHSKECVNAGAPAHTHAREAEAVLSVSRESEILGGCSLSEAVRERMEMWILYKGEGFYTLTSFGALLTVVKQYEDTYGAEAVAGIISQSISNTWKNICFDRLDERATAANPGSSFDTDEFFYAALKNTYG